MKTMSYIALFSLFISATAIAKVNPNVVLNGGGDVTPTSTVNVSLNGLVASATYNIMCYIDTSDPFEFVLFSANFGGSTGVISSYTLNDHIVKQQGQLITGRNIAIIVGTFANPSLSSINFTNLDQTNTFNVNSCYAMAIEV